jgi:zinc D-Ala-D-Ala dipeptidase
MTPCAFLRSVLAVSAASAATLLTATLLTATVKGLPARAVPVASAAGATSEPVAPPEFVALRTVVPTVIEEMRYPTPHNFIGDPVDGYQDPMCILTRPAAEALRAAQSELLRRGYSLKVYDCYRPQRAVDHFVRWAKDLQDERMKAEFYPLVDKSRLFEDGYIAEKSGHSRGSTVDLTLVKLPARPPRPYEPGERLAPCYGPKNERFPDNSVDMGTGFDCFDTLSHTDDPRVRGEQRANRQLLRSTLAEAGFTNVPEEWWHFTYRPETFPGTYFDFPAAWSSVAGHRPWGEGRAGNR